MAALAGLVSLLSLGCLAAPAGQGAVAPPAPAAPPPPPDPARSAYVESVVARARALGLDREVSWRRLLRYQEGVLGIQSQADGPDYFLAPDGPHQPAAELDAMIRGAFAPVTPGAEHPRCRFPARWRWLQSHLGVPAERLPTVACPELDAFRQRARAERVSVVFSSYYLNNPASMFGHTFLRLHRAAESADDPEEGRALLDQGVDYSAAVPPHENTLAYALKGLGGFYPGVFRMLPYFYKVREYNDAESRDLWEYDLNLDPDEVRLLVDHLWEIARTHFDYYYLDENCSYHVLAAIETASPRLNLLERVHWPVIPADTVRALVAAPGLVGQVSFRPSAKSTFRARARTLRGDLLPLVTQLGENPTMTLPASLSPDDTARVLDVAIDYIEMAHAKELLGDDRTTRGATLKQQLLERRAELDADSPDLVVTPPSQERPDRGHGSARLSWGAGVYDPARGGRPAEGFLQLDFRMALHDLSDAAAGYIPTAQIEFLATRIRFNEPRQELRVEDLSLVRLLSLNPVDRFNLRPSYRVRVGATTLRDDRCAQCTYGNVEAGGGMAVSVLDGFATLWAMADLGVHVLRFGGNPDEWARLQVGPSGGVRLQFHPRFLMVNTASLGWLPLNTGGPQRVWEASSVLRWHPTPGWSLSTEGRLQPRSTQVLGAASFYF